MSAAQVRAAAGRVVTRVAAEGRSLNEILPPALARLSDQRDRSLLQSMCYGALRFLPRLDRLLQLMLDRPLRSRDRQLHGLLVVGLYQMAYSATPAHAAIQETVQAARILRRKDATGFINAVLRRFQREGDALLQETDRRESGRYAHPQWLIDRIRADWPEAWENILDANNSQAPMWLRVNRRASSRESYLEMLAGAGRDAYPSTLVAEGVRLGEAIPVQALSGFGEGLVSVQDEGAQLAAHFLSPRKGERILDACAAPGGKTCHILENCPGVDLQALDISAPRLEQVRENLNRLNLEATIACGDVLEPASWWDGRPFDRILLDVPCSATGVIRRHPDIKVLRTEGDVARFAARQGEILDRVWGLLAPGGFLLYVTCSILKQENDEPVQAFMERHPEAKSGLKFDRLGSADSILQSRWGVQTLPQRGGMDGFYFSGIGKPGG